MIRYFESHVDFSEVEYITTNEEQISRANDAMTELGLLKGKKLDNALITQTIKPEQFFTKLRNRVQHRRGGFSEIANNMRFLYDRKDYYGLYLYLVFLFGLIQWRTPRQFAVLSANPEYLKQYLTELMGILEKYAAENSEVVASQAEDDSL